MIWLYLDLVNTVIGKLFERAHEALCPCGVEL